MRPQQRHEKVVSIIQKKIFSGELKPGDKLPTEKDLSAEMAVDRTTLRVALKQLESMYLLDIRQGDGIYVKDYLKHAGLDFLRSLFSLQEAGGFGGPVDVYLIDEAMEFWNLVLPEVIKFAAGKLSPMDLKALMNIFLEELNNIEDREKLVRLELENQDFIAHVANNLILKLLFNSSRIIRKKMIEIYFNCLSREEIKEHVDAKIKLLQDFGKSNKEEVRKGIVNFSRLLERNRIKVKKVMLDSDPLGPN